MAALLCSAMSSEEFLFLRPPSGEPGGEGGGWGLALRTVGMRRGIGRQLHMHQGNFNQPILTSSRKSSLTYPPLPRLEDDKCAQHEQSCDREILWDYGIPEKRSQKAQAGEGKVILRRTEGPSSSWMAF